MRNGAIIWRNCRNTSSWIAVILNRKIHYPARQPFLNINDDSKLSFLDSLWQVSFSYAFRTENYSRGEGRKSPRGRKPQPNNITEVSIIYGILTYLLATIFQTQKTRSHCFIALRWSYPVIERRSIPTLLTKTTRKKWANYLPDI